MTSDGVVAWRLFSIRRYLGDHTGQQHVVLYLLKLRYEMRVRDCAMQIRMARPDWKDKIWRGHRLVEQSDLHGHVLKKWRDTAALEAL